MNYAATGAQDPTQIMQCHSPAQVPILSALARSYAVSDAWFASVPSQTWPNRAFAHAGTSNGHVDNGSPPDPLLWDVPTVFNVIESTGASWGIYSDAIVAPSLHPHHVPETLGSAAGFAFPQFHRLRRCLRGQHLAELLLHRAELSSAAER